METGACPIDPELLRLAAGEPASAGVRDHLAGCADCRGRVERMRAEVASLRQAATELTPAGRRPGDAEAGTNGHRPDYIGKYLVVGELDAGGQARVYRAVHPGLGKDLVIKIAHEPIAPGRLDRALLAAEGQRLAELDHPGLVRVYDLDVHDGRPFLAMEYVPGRNLRQLAEQERPAPRRAAALVAAVARAAAAAHRRGVVHRDIKPQNILVDEAGRPRLIDFGMARLRHAWGGDGDGPSGGTLEFMAPEQARGEPERVGPQSDVFALGAVLYALLTGAAPFAGRTAAESQDRARRCDFDRSKLKAAGLPRRLGRICARAMAAEPSDRYATAEGLADALDGFLGRRRRAGGVVVAALAVAALGVGWWSRRADLPPAPTPAAAGEVTASVRGGTTPAGAPGVEALQIHLLRRTTDDRGQPVSTPLGRLGVDAFAARFGGDDVRVEARLGGPAYCYLIALNPDGKEQLCHPPDEATPPVQSDTLSYPQAADEGFALTDGVGLQAFVLVASRRPLPAYRAWRSGVDGLPWRPTDAGPGWWYDGKHFEPFKRERDQPRKLAGLPPPFAETCRAFQARAGGDAIRAVAFPVQPAPAPDPPREPERSSPQPGPPPTSSREPSP